jgi:redox-sensitive bicupin YhaK (pirin superfamily)
MTAPARAAAAARRLVHVTRGARHGPITRLMSPSDLGQYLKPFVFLDLFEGVRLAGMPMPLHPHSGIATVTVITEGDARFDDPVCGRGTLSYGGVEWMRASGGVWHGQELGQGASATIKGFQLWLALPRALERGAPEPQYLEARDMLATGPATVILGEYGGARSPVRSFEGVTYLLVTLEPGERWTYHPPAGETVAWAALSKGALTGEAALTEGDLGLFEPGAAPIPLQAGDAGAVLVIGSAVPHPHALHLGRYSVHTSREALIAGEVRIRELARALQTAGDRRTATGNVPVFR